MGLFGRGYDRDYDQGYGYGNRQPGSRSFWGRSGAAIGPNEDYGRSGRWDRDRGWGARSGYEGDFNRYDRNYKSQWQTDYGDPFGDREQQTPMRVIRGDSNRSRGGLFSNRYDRGYDRGYDDSGYPMGYRPYAARSGYDRDFNRIDADTGYNRRTYRTYGNRYDSGWY